MRCWLSRSVSNYRGKLIILVDDIVLTGKDEDSLAHLALRGRHFNISLMMCAVSYTTLPKRCRRSLDCLCLFSLPMAGDAKLLCQEYASKTNMAQYCLQNLEEHQCLVMETAKKAEIVLLPCGPRCRAPK